VTDHCLTPHQDGALSPQLARLGDGAQTRHLNLEQNQHSTTNYPSGN
jgi:hypothetical protein